MDIIAATFGHTIRAGNVNEALPKGMHLLQYAGVESESRGLKTLRVPGPVSTIYNNPMERVLFCPIRDANPFFHLMESLWIIGGSDRCDLPAYFLSSIRNFSDDGITFHGAYGYRLRYEFGFDQIDMAVQMLSDKPDTRQCVLSIWNPGCDLGMLTKDMPCNDLIMLDIVGGKLNMTVCNRSNDVIWGAYGANAVQFSMLQEFIAARVGVSVGKYVQQSNNYHVYTDNPTWLKFLEGEYTHGQTHNPYSLGDVDPWPMAQNVLSAMEVEDDCRTLCKLAETGVKLTGGNYRSLYFEHVVVPMIGVYDTYKRDDLNHAMSLTMLVAADDWRLAAQQWLQRRIDKRAAK